MHFFKDYSENSEIECSEMKHYKNEKWTNSGTGLICFKGCSHEYNKNRPWERYSFLKTFLKKAKSYKRAKKILFVLSFFADQVELHRDGVGEEIAAVNVGLTWPGGVLNQKRKVKLVNNN